MLGCPEINMEILNNSMKTVEFSKYKEISRVNRVANRVLTIIYNKTWFSYKYRYKVINLYT